MTVLGDLGTHMVLRSSVYWGMAIVLIVVTKGKLGCHKADGGRVLPDGRVAASEDAAERLAR